MHCRFFHRCVAEKSCVMHTAKDHHFPSLEEIRGAGQLDLVETDIEGICPENHMRDQHSVLTNAVEFTLNFVS